MSTSRNEATFQVSHPIPPLTTHKTSHITTPVWKTPFLLHPLYPFNHITTLYPPTLKLLELTLFWPHLIHQYDSPITHILTVHFVTHIAHHLNGKVHAWFTQYSKRMFGLNTHSPASFYNRNSHSHDGKRAYIFSTTYCMLNVANFYNGFIYHFNLWYSFIGDFTWTK